MRSILCVLFYLAVVDCGFPPTMQNARVSFNSTVFNNSATYTCHTGYVFNSSIDYLELKCDVNETNMGHWTHKDNLPHCTGMEKAKLLTKLHLTFFCGYIILFDCYCYIDLKLCSHSVTTLQYLA